ncbi:MAG: MFS transporter [Clostridia bacterium]|nr:MFS transporter [Clostridia bacterium]
MNTDIKKYKILTLAAFLLYVTYLAAKNVYTSEIIEITRHFGVSKSAASAAASFSFVSYALAQIVFVKYIGRLNAVKYLLICSPLSVALFGLVPFCTEIWQVWIIFALLGAILSGVFPVCMLVISEYLPDELVSPANKYMGVAFSLSFMLDYFFSALFIKVFDWRLGFYVFPLIYLVSALFFCRVLNLCPRRQREEAEETRGKKTDKKTVFLYLFTAGMIGLLVNMLYYATSGWVPNLLSEQFGLSPALSVLITLLIPLTGAVGAAVCLELCRRFPFWRVVILCTAVSLALSLILTGVYRAALLLTLFLVIALLFFVRGVSHVFGWQVPINARRIMDPSSAATVLNIFSCVGAAAGPVLFGALTDTCGYTAFFVAAAVSSAALGAFMFAGKKIIN